MRTIALEYGRLGVTANSVAPGWIATASSEPDELEAAKHTPLGRPGTPDEVAGLIVEPDDSIASLTEREGEECPVLERLETQHSPSDVPPV